MAFYTADSKPRPYNPQPPSGNLWVRETSAYVLWWQLWVLQGTEKHHAASLVRTNRRKGQSAPTRPQSSPRNSWTQRETECTWRESEHEKRCSTHRIKFIAEQIGKEYCKTQQRPSGKSRETDRWTKSTQKFASFNSSIKNRFQQFLSPFGKNTCYGRKD